MTFFWRGILSGVIAELQIVQTKVEMNDIPLSVAEPLINGLNTARRRTTVSGRSMDVDLALERFPRGDGVADRNGGADEQHSRQPGDVLHRRISGVFYFLFGLRFRVLPRNRYRCNC